MTKRIIFLLLLFLSVHSMAQIPNDYYKTCEGKTGEQLKQCLHEIIDDHDDYKYTDSKTDVWDILKETDKDPNNSDNVILVYSGISTDAKQEYNNGNGWEREHVWSASHGPFERTDVPGTDVHHLKPVHSYFNRSTGKWARDFDYCNELILFNGNGYDCYLNKEAFEPRDAVKGDIARMLFYMAVRYEGDDGYPDLELVDKIPTSLHPNKSPQYGKLSVLLKWHKMDPVDEFERNRNNIIYKYQNNRNPFIDHPEFVNLIW